MSSSTDHQPAKFVNTGSRIAVQASQYIVHGNSIVQHSPDALAQLPHAAEAPFNSYAKQHEPICLSDTRVDLLREICSWADGPDERCIFWLSGLAGTGKSTIARTIARRYHDKQGLAASFFFSRGGGDVSHAGKFVMSIAVQLAHSVPALQQYISHAVAECDDIVSQSLRDQWQRLVYRPLSKLQKPGPYVIVVDALDECDSDSNIRIIVQLLAEARSLTGVQLRVLLTSRPVVPIRHEFKQIAHVEHKDLELHVDHDIRLFLENNLRSIGQERGLGTGWPCANIIVQLVQSASGLFIWAATVCRFIRDGRRFATKRLETILCSDGNTIAAPEKHLNLIYQAVLSSSLSPDYTDEEKKEHCNMLRNVLGSVVVLFSPLSTRYLSALLHVTEEYVTQTLEDLHAILNIPEDLTQPLRLHHPSFRDFLLSKDRCHDDSFWVDESSTHKKLASRCLELMSAPNGFRQDMCNLSEPTTLRNHVEEETVASNLSPELQYACRYWVEHLERSQGNITDGDAVHVFLQTHLLHWLEAMSLIREMDQCVRLLARLQALAAPSASDYISFLRDASRSVLKYGAIIEGAPLQVYLLSAFVFAPETSVVRNMFVDQIPQTVEMLSGREEDRHACRSVPEGHPAFITDRQPVASASVDTTVRVRETATGKGRSKLVGHLRAFTAVAFSPDGQLVTSAAMDYTVRVWETAAGTCLGVLKGHSTFVNAVVFSPDGQLIASASVDNTVRVWETATGTCRSVLKGHLALVNTVVFSPDGQLVASASDDKTVQVWDTATGTCFSKLVGHSAFVNGAVFSPDRQLVASASNDKTVRVWETATGTCCSELVGHSAFVSAVVFSPDGQLVASASDDKTVRVWETATSTCRSELKGHSDYVKAVVFSPDGQLVASASLDSTVRVWDTATGTCCCELKGHTDYVRTVVFSPDGQLIASASNDNTARVWETATGKCRSKLVGHSDHVRIVVFSLDGQLVASASRDRTVRVWNAATGTCCRVITGHL